MTYAGGRTEGLSVSTKLRHLGVRAVFGNRDEMRRKVHTGNHRVIANGRHVERLAQRKGRRAHPASYVNNIFDRRWGCTILHTGHDAPLDFALEICVECVKAVLGTELRIVVAMDQQVRGRTVKGRGPVNVSLDITVKGSHTSRCIVTVCAAMCFNFVSIEVLDWRVIT